MLNHIAARLHRALAVGVQPAAIGAATMRGITAWVAGVGLLALATAGNAQVHASIDAHAAMARIDALSPASAPLSPTWLDQRAITTTLRFDHRFGQLSGDGVVRDGDVATRATGGLAALIETPAWRGLRLSASLAARHAPNDGASLAVPDSLLLAQWSPAAKLPSWGSQSTARVSYANGANLAWIAVTDRHGAAKGDSLSSLHYATGVARQFGGIMLGISLGSQTVLTTGIPARFDNSHDFHVTVVDTLSGTTRDSTFTGTKGDSAVAGSLRRWTDVAARFGWVRGRFAFDAVISARPRLGSYASAVWGDASGVAALSSHIAVVGGLRTTAPLPGILTMPRRSLQLGLRIAPAALWRATSTEAAPAVASAFDVRRSAPGEYTVSLRLPNARAVELAGDFTEWKAMSLRQVDATRWEITLRVAAGSHRCNIRVNGAEWVPPPGLTAMDDEFNGRVGLFVVG